jgi:hypothetical protein
MMNLKCLILYEVDDWTQTFMPHISHLEDVNRFRRIRKGMPVHMKLTVGLYRFNLLL